LELLSADIIPFQLQISTKVMAIFNLTFKFPL
jgi:hypothetical protein